MSSSQPMPGITSGITSTGEGTSTRRKPARIHLPISMPTDRRRDWGRARRMSIAMKKTVPHTSNTLRKLKNSAIVHLLDLHRPLPIAPLHFASTVGEVTESSGFAAESSPASVEVGVGIWVESDVREPKVDDWRL